jgi:hypothetical protein
MEGVMPVTRIQFEADAEKMAEIEALMAGCGIETRKELFNNALTLLKWAIEHTRQGHTIAAIDEKNQVYRELQMPILDHISTK